MRIKKYSGSFLLALLVGASTFVLTFQLRKVHAGQADATPFVARLAESVITTDGQSSLARTMVYAVRSDGTVIQGNFRDSILSGILATRTISDVGAGSYKVISRWSESPVDIPFIRIYGSNPATP